MEDSDEWKVTSDEQRTLLTRFQLVGLGIGEIANICASDVGSSVQASGRFGKDYVCSTFYAQFAKKSV
jgi:hypothetical protein